MYRQTREQAKYDDNKPKYHEMIIQSHHPNKLHDYKQNRSSMPDAMSYTGKPHQHILHGQRNGRHVEFDLKESIL